MTCLLEDLLRDGLGDCRLNQLRFTEGGENLCISFERPGREGDLCVEFVWVVGLRVELNFGDYQGSPLVGTSTFTRLDRDRWSVVIEFSPAPEGCIVLECNEVRVVQS